MDVNRIPARREQAPVLPLPQPQPLPQLQPQPQPQPQPQLHPQPQPQPMSAAWPAVDPAEVAGQCLEHGEPGFRWVGPMLQSLDMEASDSGSDSESVGDCIAALIEMSQHSDRPERESAWAKALPPVAQALVALSFQPASEHERVRAEAAARLAGSDEVFAVDALYGRSVLHWVCLLGDTLMVDAVLRHQGARCVNDQDYSGHVPLNLLCVLRTAPVRRASLPGASEIARLLLANGARLDDLPHRGGELLFLPDLTPALASRLLGMGVAVDAAGAGGDGGTPLLAACARSQWALAEWLLESGANPRATGRFRASLLHHGAMPESLAQRLLAAGAAPNARDMTGQTPLMAACEAGNPALVRLLLQSGASPEAVDDDGQSVLDYATLAGTAFAQLIREALMLQSSLKLADS